MHSMTQSTALRGSNGLPRMAGLGVVIGRAHRQDATKSPLSKRTSQSCQAGHAQHDAKHCFARLERPATDGRPGGGNRRAHRQDATKSPLSKRTSQSCQAGHAQHDAKHCFARRGRDRGSAGPAGLACVAPCGASDEVMRMVDRYRTRHEGWKVRHYYA